MTPSRRLVLGVAALVVLAAGVITLAPRFRTDLTRVTGALDGSAGEGAGDSVGQPSLPPTSEELIAAALEAGDLTYEESLLQRAYAMFDDPRLEPAFRSLVIDWEAGTALFIEIDSKEATLSTDLLAKLEPFRVRPNDPRSIYNQPRADAVKAQYLPAAGWESLPVPGTRTRVWGKSTHAQLGKYVAMTQRVWSVFNQFLPYPSGDNGDPASQINPDQAIDIYLLNGPEVDPRNWNCYSRAVTGTQTCMLMTTYGRTLFAPPIRGRRSSGYLLINAAHPDDKVMGTIAHELAHVTQNNYDYLEIQNTRSKWVIEGTASWVEHKVLKALSTTPEHPYEKLAAATVGLFSNLHRGLDMCCHFYGTWLYFFHASLELGDDVVTKVWDKASGVDATTAVNLVIPFNQHLPRFAVRNVNDDDPLPVLWLYRTHDRTFPRFEYPYPQSKFDTPAPVTELEAPEEPIPHLASAYFTFRFPANIRRVTVQNMYHDLPDARVWAIQKLGGQWKDPEDWSRETQRIFCRDYSTEDLAELVLIITNTHEQQAFPSGHPKPRVLAEDVGCPVIEGWATSTLRLRDDAQDMSYVSSRANLRFRPRTVQDQPGNVQYDLLPTAVTWTAAGRKGDCTVAGQAVVTVPSFLDQPLDPSRPAHGYMNVVGLDGGDFHSIEVSAVDPAAMMTKTCPGDPPVVTKEPFGSVWLLHVLSEKNTHSGGVVYRGKQTLDPANVQANLPMSPGQALSSLQNAPGAGAFITPEIQRQLKEAQEALNRMAAESGGKVVYTFEWDLKPAAGPPAASAP